MRRAVKLTDTGSYDLIHLTLPNTWRRYASVRGALVVTVHDLSHLVCPEHQTDRNIASLGEGLEFARRARARYVSVSESTAGQMVDLLDVGRQSIDVILEGVDRNRFTPQVDASARQRVAERYQLSTEPFFLCLGTIEPRKNLLNTVRAFRRFASQERSSTAKLVIAGAQGWGESNALRREIAACPQISEIGYVEEEDLPTLYQMCRTFCYLSHYEGFGLPVAEAMACGAPVLFGDASSLPEVASGGGLGAAPHDVEAIAAALRRMWSDDALRARLARRALERARELDWREAARRTLRTYENCLVQPIERTRREVGRGLFEAA